MLLFISDTYFRKFTPVRKKSSKMEDVLLRFGHIGLEIFLSLDVQSLTKCQEASKSWKTFIDNEKIAPFKIIKEKTKIPTKNVWKAIRESSLEFAIELANEVNSVYKIERHFSEDMTPLREAAYKGKLAACKLIIENTEDKNPKDNMGTTLLHDLVDSFSCTDDKIALESYRFVMKYVEDKNPADNSGRTPLHEASLLDSCFEICQLIIENVEDKNPRDDEGTTPFDLAAREGNLKICYLIVENLKAKDIPKFFINGWTQFHIAAIYGDLTTFREMLQITNDVNPYENFAITPLHFATGFGHLDICKLIMKKIWNKNPKCQTGSTPLHMAAQHGHLEICRLIFQQFDKSQNFNPSNDSDRGDTPLSLAAAGNFTDVCKLILDNCKDKNPMDNTGQTPLHYAAQNGNLTVCQLIAKDLHDKNPQTASGWTPLHSAAHFGHLEVFKFIFGIIKDKQPKTGGRTPLDIAVRQEHYEICQFIKDSRSNKDSVNHL